MTEQLLQLGRTQCQQIFGETLGLQYGGFNESRHCNLCPPVSRNYLELSVVIMAGHLLLLERILVTRNSLPSPRVDCKLQRSLGQYFRLTRGGGRRQRALQIRSLCVFMRM